MVFDIKMSITHPKRNDSALCYWVIKNVYAFRTLHDFLIMLITLEVLISHT
jgi:hypothetical protein